MKRTFILVSLLVVASFVALAYVNTQQDRPAVLPVSAEADTSRSRPVANPVAEAEVRDPGEAREQEAREGIAPEPESSDQTAEVESLGLGGVGSLEAVEPLDTGAEAGSSDQTTVVPVPPAGPFGKGSVKIDNEGTWYEMPDGRLKMVPHPPPPDPKAVKALEEKYKSGWRPAPLTPGPAGTTPPGRGPGHHPLPTSGGSQAQGSGGIGSLEAVEPPATVPEAGSSGRPAEGPPGGPFGKFLKIDNEGTWYELPDGRLKMVPHPPPPDPKAVKALEEKYRSGWRPSPLPPGIGGPTPPERGPGQHRPPPNTGSQAQGSVGVGSLQAIEPPATAPEAGSSDQTTAVPVPPAGPFGKRVKADDTGVWYESQSGAITFVPYPPPLFFQKYSGVNQQDGRRYIGVSLWRYGDGGTWPYLYNWQTRTWEDAIDDPYNPNDGYPGYYAVPVPWSNPYVIAWDSWELHHDGTMPVKHQISNNWQLQVHQNSVWFLNTTPMGGGSGWPVPEGYNAGWTNLQGGNTEYYTWWILSQQPP